MMTDFQNWWDGYFHEINGQKETAQAAWKTATLAERERCIANQISDAITLSATAGQFKNRGTNRRNQMIVYTEVRYDTYVGFISSIHTEQMPYSNIKFTFDDDGKLIDAEFIKENLNEPKPTSTV